MTKDIRTRLCFRIISPKCFRSQREAAARGTYSRGGRSQLRKTSNGSRGSSGCRLHRQRIGTQPQAMIVIANRVARMMCRSQTDGERFVIVAKNIA
jgi:hypothetical protein